MHSHGHAREPPAWQQVSEAPEFVVVRRKQRAAADPVANVLQHLHTRCAAYARPASLAPQTSVRPTAHAIASPSVEEVPRPISSTTTNDWAVALAKMAAVSSISTMNVDLSRARSSEAPTRANNLSSARGGREAARNATSRADRSTTPIEAVRAGTNDPAWASTTACATCRKNVDLPERTDRNEQDSTRYNTRDRTAHVRSRYQPRAPRRVVRRSRRREAHVIRNKRARRTRSAPAIFHFCTPVHDGIRALIGGVGSEPALQQRRPPLQQRRLNHGVAPLSHVQRVARIDHGPHEVARDGHLHRRRRRRKKAWAPASTRGSQSTPPHRTSASADETSTTAAARAITPIGAAAAANASQIRW